MVGQDGQDKSGLTRAGKGGRGAVVVFPALFPVISPSVRQSSPFQARGVIQIGLVQAMFPSSITTRR